MASGPVTEILAQAKGVKTIKISMLDRISQAIELLQEHKLVMNVNKEDEKTLVINITGGEGEQSELLQELVRAELPLTAFNVEQESLESIFMKVTQEVKAR